MVDVFGRTLPVYQQALVLLAVLLAISSTNMTCGAMRHRLLVRARVRSRMPPQHSRV